MSDPSQPSVQSLQATLLTESVRSRASQARLAYISTFISMGAFTPLLLQTVPTQSILLWFVPVIVTLSWRMWIAHQVTTKRDLLSERDAVAFDRKFRFNSIINQAFVGAGIWTVATAGSEITPYFVTLVVSLFGMGAAASLGNDFRTVAVSIPICIGQPVVFWALRGWDGLHVSTPLLTIMVLLIAFARQSQRIHTDSIAIRYKNDELLERLEQEKATAVRAQHEAEEANRSKSRFLAAASHDLRQPLYAVTMLKDTLAMHDLPDKVRQIVQQQGIALDALSSLFDNLLQISRLESGNVEVHLESVPLDSLLEQLANEVRPACQAKGIVLELVNQPGFVESDPELLGRLLRNLLNNAVRYCDAGKVSIRASSSGQTTAISISDTGLGIPEKDQQRVFDEFVQLNNPQRNREQGVGLGLAIVRHIAKLLDVKIDLESQPGKGTTIGVTLPRSAPPQQHATPDHIHRAPSLRPLTAKYLWIVEDDELVRSAFETHLNALGVAVNFAVSRDELVRLAESRGWPDYAILDDMLGGSESGLDIAYWLMTRMPRNRIMIVTGNAEPARLEELGGSPFAVKRKPVSSDELFRWMSE